MNTTPNRNSKIIKEGGSNMKSSKKEMLIENSLDNNSDNIKITLIESVADSVHSIDLINATGLSGTPIAVSFGGDFSPTGRISLIQIAIHDNIILFDILTCPAILTESRISDILYSPDIVKVMYDCRHSCTWLRTHCDIILNNVYDIQCGYSVVNNKKMYERNRLTQILKEYKFSCVNVRNTICSPKQWSIRPLTKSQLQLAAYDVFYLVRIYNMMLIQLDEQKQLQWINWSNMNAKLSTLNEVTSPSSQNHTTKHNTPDKSSPSVPNPARECTRNVSALSSPVTSHMLFFDYLCRLDRSVLAKCEIRHNLEGNMDLHSLINSINLYYIYIMFSAI
jgi:hypothetical protein